MRTVQIAFGLLLSLTPVGAAEIVVFAPGALRPGMEAVAPAFASSTGHTLKVVYGGNGASTARVLKGETADVVMETPAALAALPARLLDAGSQRGLFRIGIGLYAARNVPTATLDSVDRLKDVLRRAESVGYVDPATGALNGTYIAAMLQTIGIADELKPKIRLLPSGLTTFDPVAAGDVHIAFGRLTDIRADKRVQLISALPDAVQNYARYDAALLASAANRPAAIALLDVMTSANMQPALRELGFDAP